MLPQTTLDAVRDLARHGTPEQVIRSALGISRTEWKAAMEPDAQGGPSPLAGALEMGRAEIAKEVFSFFLREMRENQSMTAAKWLADRVGLNAPADDKATSEPRIQILINNPMSEVQYRESLRVGVDED